MAEQIVTGTDFVTVPTKDIDAAVDFYENVLGLERSIQWGEMPGHEFETGNLTIAVWEPEAFGAPYRPSGSTIEFRVADHDAAKAELESRGIEFQGETIDSGVCKQSFFADPDGNSLAIHHRYKPRQ